MNIVTEFKIKRKEDLKTFSITLTTGSRKYLTYTAIAVADFFLVRHLVNSVR